MRIGERLGLYDHHALDMGAPVYDTFRRWVIAHHDHYAKSSHKGGLSDP